MRSPEPREEPVSSPADPFDPRAAPDEHGQTMIYSTSARTRQPLEEAQTRRAARALLAVGGRRLIVPPGGGTIGRSRECDIVLDDAGASRRHAEIRPDPQVGRSVTSPRPMACASTAARSTACSRCARETVSRSARPRSSSSSDDHARTRIGGTEVRLSRRPLPVPAVGGAQRAEGSAWRGPWRAGRGSYWRRGDPGRRDGAVLSLSARQRRRRPPRAEAGGRARTRATTPG